MAERALFPVGLPRLVRWAENQKSLPEVLHMAGSMFEARARSHSTFVGIVLNFLCVLLVFCMVLVVPALFLPLITLISTVVGVSSTSIGERRGHRTHRADSRAKRLAATRTSPRTMPARQRPSSTLEVDPAELERLSRPDPWRLQPPDVPDRRRGGLVLAGDPGRRLGSDRRAPRRGRS